MNKRIIRWMLLVFLTSHLICLRIVSEKGEDFNLDDFPLSSTSIELKKKVSEVLKLPPEILRIYGRIYFELPDDMRLEEFGMTQLSTVNVKVDYFVRLRIGKTEITSILPRATTVRDLLKMVQLENPWIVPKRGALRLGGLLLPSTVTSFSKLSEFVPKEYDPIFLTPNLLVLLTPFTLTFKGDDFGERAVDINDGFTDSFSKILSEFQEYKEDHYMICSDPDCFEFIINSRLAPYAFNIYSDKTLYIKQANKCDYVLLGLIGEEDIIKCVKNPTLAHVEAFLRGFVTIQNEVKYFIEGETYSNKDIKFNSIPLSKFKSNKIRYDLSCTIIIEGLPQGVQNRFQEDCTYPIYLLHQKMEGLIDHPFFYFSVKNSPFEVAHNERSIWDLIPYSTKADSLILTLRTDTNVDFEVYLETGPKSLKYKQRFGEITLGKLREVYQKITQIDSEKLKDVEIYLQQSPLTPVKTKGMPDEKSLRDLMDLSFRRGINFGEYHLFCEYLVPFNFKNNISGKTELINVDYYSTFSAIKGELSSKFYDGNPPNQAYKILVFRVNGETVSSDNSANSINLQPSSEIEVFQGFKLFIKKEIEPDEPSFEIAYIYDSELISYYFDKFTEDVGPEFKIECQIDGIVMNDLKQKIKDIPGIHEGSELKLIATLNIEMLIF